MYHLQVSHYTASLPSATSQSRHQSGVEIFLWAKGKLVLYGRGLSVNNFHQLTEEQWGFVSAIEIRECYRDPATLNSIFSRVSTEVLSSQFKSSFSTTSSKFSTLKQKVTQKAKAVIWKVRVLHAK